MPLLSLGIGAAIWFSFPSLTGKLEPYDDDDFWVCMLATSALAGLVSPRRAWLSGLAVAAVPLVDFVGELISQWSRYWWPGLGVFVAFVALCAVVSQLAATLRELALVALGRGPVEVSQ